MDWIKRNVMLVVGGVIVLVLFGAGGFYLWSNLQKNSKVTAELNQATDEVQRLYNNKPSINDQNLQLLGEDKKRVEEVMTQAKARFRSVGGREMDIASYKKLLDETLFQLTRDAEAAKVTIPANYNFTFEEQKKAVQFVPGTIAPLTERLAEVKSLVEVLYKSGVHSVDRVRRVAVSPDDRQGSPDYLVETPKTNELAGMVSIPYEITFSGFTKELAQVMSGLSQAPEFIIVRNMTSELAPPPVQAAPAQPVPVIRVLPGAQAPIPTPQNECSGGGCSGCECGGGGGGGARRPTLPPAGGAATGPRIVIAPPKPTSNVLLDEQLLRFTLRLDVVVPISTNSVPSSESSAGAASSTGAN
jgi:hypothetical protein